MAIKTITTAAIITAQDETGTVFSRVAEKLRAMETRAEGATKKLQATTKAASTAQAAGPKAERASGIVPGIPSIITAVIAAESIRALAVAIGERIHEGVRLEAAGMPAADIERGKTLSANLARKYPSVPQTEFLHMYGTAIAVTGSAADAEVALEKIAPLRLIAAQSGGADSVTGLDDLLKSAEIKGVTRDPKEFERYMDAVAKAMEVFPNVKPVEYFEAVKHARQAGLGLNEEFFGKVAPTLIQEMGGASFGTNIAAFNRAIVGGHMEHSALKRIAELGLVDPKNLDYLSTGEVKGLKPGTHIEGYKVAQENPYKWVQQYLVPALAKHGVTSKEDILATIPQLFSTATAGQIVEILATQGGRIEKDRALLERAPGLKAAEIYQAKDVGVQAEGVKNAAMSFAETVGGNLVTHTDALNKLSGALGAFNEKMTGAGPVASLAVAVASATAALAAFTGVVAAARWAIGGATAAAGGAAAAAGAGARGLGAAAAGLFSPIPLALAGEDERARQLLHGHGFRLGTRLRQRGAFLRRQAA